MEKKTKEVYESQHRILNTELLKGCNQSKIYIDVLYMHYQENVKLPK